MKRILLFSLMTVSLQHAFAFHIEYGKNVVISKPVYENVYVSGGTVTIDAPVYGDLVIAGGTVIINDSVQNDILLAAGDVTFSGYAGGDIRCAGGKIRISANVNGDVVVAGGEMTLDKGVIIGNLLVTGGDIRIDGDVHGSVRGMFSNLFLNGNVTKDIDCRGGTVTLNGYVGGKSILAAKLIFLGSRAAFNNDVRYWSEQDALTFTSHMLNGKAVYDPSLRVPVEKWYFLGSTSLFLLLWYLGMALVMISIIQYLFPVLFKKTADTVYNHPLKSAGFGILYFIGIPVAMIVCFLTVIGVPVGFLLAIGYILSILLATVITSIVTANWFNNRFDKKWSYWGLVLTAFWIFIVLKLTFLTPVVGWIILVLMTCFSFGAILLSITWRKNKQAIVQEG